MGITGAQALIKFLEEEHVKYIFGYPGGAVLALYDAILESKKIKHVLVRQEQAAVHAASGYARVTGRPGVCLATSGPGATNLVTGLATAYMDSIPVVAITGQVGTDMIGTDAFQEVDIFGITMPITKHNYLVKDVNDLPKVVKEAFHIASTGRPGPVLIDIPKNVSGAVFDYQPPGPVDLRGYKPTYKGHPAQIKNLAKFIQEAERPVILAGGGVISSNANEELYALAEKINAPVTTTLMGLGAFPEDHQLSLGMLGLHGTPYANYAVTNCDLLISLGVRFDDRVISVASKFAPQAKIVHIDIDPAEIGKNVIVDLPIVGDVRLVLEELLKKVTKKEHHSWLQQVKAWKESHPMVYGNLSQLRPQYVIEKLGELTRGKAIITTDVGQHQMWAAQFYKFTKPRSFISSGGLGTMGYGFPAAVGAQLASPDSLVVAITGDGSFQMNMAEMGTATEQCLPIKILLFNNSYLSLVRQLQHFLCGKRYCGVEFTGNPDFVQLANSYPGAVGLRIEKPEDVEPVLKEAINNGKLTVIECRVSEEELVYPVVPPGRSLDEMIHYPVEEGGTNE
ncbi:biosynthetic-type acetolactate synthase large subunit [Zhaonella formicivorans]|uniref:biosynthetic-type acetolactate synthase large subunit n=1 Tax=Zhaonella formicivorans TaxID=2528593 RepID=UPI0010E75828|nr:biosynthetic-type acetolactate synthase large subunit [Zhaonella formicivorans]